MFRMDIPNINGDLSDEALSCHLPTSWSLTFANSQTPATTPSQRAAITSLQRIAPGSQVFIEPMDGFETASARQSSRSRSSINNDLCLAEELAIAISQHDACPAGYPIPLSAIRRSSELRRVNRETPTLVSSNVVYSITHWRCPQSWRASSLLSLQDIPRWATQLTVTVLTSY